AQNNLAALYYTGDGVVQSYDNAFKWYSKSTAQGDLEAQTNLGGLYHFGHGVEKDLDKALELYRDAATKGHQRAKDIIQVLIQEGIINH
ncbi:tetratricopeptide repeat protein, partial [Psychrobacter sp. HII-4]|uniref:tetratricopeptide repeat protein n=1 Tax=Psychrobacter sp. HII-4 TaxID=1569264 RepID=UPI001918BE52